MKQVKIFALLVCLAAAGCAAAPATKKSPVIIGTDWTLIELRTPTTTIKLDRPALETAGNGDIYTLRFEGENRVFGKAAPNRYNAVCSWGDDSTLSIGPTVTTQMLALEQPWPVKEQEFFYYLEQVCRCSLTADRRLELYTLPDENGLKTVLVFAEQ